MPSTSEPKDQLEDRELVRLVQSGDKAAFEILIRRHQDKILNLCFRLLGQAGSARELAGDIFAEAFRSISGFQGRSEFGTWLYRVGLNRVYAHIRRTVRKRSFEEPLILPDQNQEREVPAETVHPLEALELEEKRFRIRKVLAGLSKDHAQMLILHDVEGRSYEEMSELLEIPIGTVMSRLSRAREAFRKKWNKIC